MDVGDVWPLVLRPLRIPTLKSRLEVGRDPERLGRRGPEGRIAKQFALTVTAEVAGPPVGRLCKPPEEHREREQAVSGQAQDVRRNGRLRELLQKPDRPQRQQHNRDHEVAEHVGVPWVKVEDELGGEVAGEQRQQRQSDAWPTYAQAHEASDADQQGERPNLFHEEQRNLREACGDVDGHHLCGGLLKRLRGDNPVEVAETLWPGPTSVRPRGTTGEERRIAQHQRATRHHRPADCGARETTAELSEHQPEQHPGKEKEGEVVVVEESHAQRHGAQRERSNAELVPRDQQPNRHRRYDEVKAVDLASDGLQQKRRGGTAQQCEGGCGDLRKAGLERAKSVCDEGYQCHGSRRAAGGKEMNPPRVWTDGNQTREVGEQMKGGVPRRMADAERPGRVDQL